MNGLKNIVKYIGSNKRKNFIKESLPLAKLVNNKLYILNTDGTYIKIKKQKLPEYICDISELEKYK